MTGLAVLFILGLPIVLALLSAVVTSEALGVGAHEVGLLAGPLVRRIGARSAVMIVTLIMWGLIWAVWEIGGFWVMWGLGFLTGALAATLLRDWMTWRRAKR